MICYHHTDMDGKSAGYLVHKYKPSSIEDSPSSYIPTNYEDAFDKHSNKNDVFIVDISISESTYPAFLKVCETARTVTWIDHHQTSVDVISEHRDELQSLKNLTYFVSTESCGAALVYSFFNLPKLTTIRQTKEGEYYNIAAKYLGKGKIKITGGRFNKDDPTDSTWSEWDIMLPQWLALVNDYDCWKNENPQTNKFILGTESTNTQLVLNRTDESLRKFNPFWDTISNDSAAVIDYITKGESIQEYLDSKYANELFMTFEWKYGDTTFLCKNSTGNSWNFCDLIDRYPAVILFKYNGKIGMWTYSVYSSDKSKFDCSKFCQQFGGGGHVHASGFSTKDLIFTAKNLKPTVKKDVIFLGGTTNESEWRSEFIDAWKKADSPLSTSIELFNPVVEDWTEEDQKKEEEVKSTARLNLFVITPEMMGSYSLCEAVECSHYSKTFLAIYDKNHQFTIPQLKSFNAIGKLVESHGGKYCTYIGNNQEVGINRTIHDLVNDIISYI